MAFRGAATMGALWAPLRSDPQRRTHTHTQKRGVGPCPTPTQERVHCVFCLAVFHAARFVTSERELSEEHCAFKNDIKQKPSSERRRRGKDGSAYPRNRRERPPGCEVGS